MRAPGGITHHHPPPTAMELFTKLRDACGGPARIAAAGPLLSTSTITALTKPMGDTLLESYDSLLYYTHKATLSAPPHPSSPSGPSASHAASTHLP